MAQNELDLSSKVDLNTDRFRHFTLYYSFSREFIEAQKIWVVRERERVDRENREIAAFIENKDKWKIKVN